MESKTTSVSNGGISALGLLGVIFVVLKLFGLTEVATWSWWWVTAPFWVGFAILGIVLIGGLIFYFFVTVFKGK